jgi:hypothetical protein
VTGTDRGRGRPVTSFPDHVAAAYLAAVAEGTPQGKAAADLGVSPRTVRYHAQHHPDFAAALADAKTRGLDARYPHGHPYRYRHLGCRCPDICVPAASAARSNRRRKARTTKEDTNDRPDAHITHLPPPVGDFPPLRPAV